MEKICPIMSGNYAVGVAELPSEVPCLKAKCQLWVKDTRLQKIDGKVEYEAHCGLIAR